MPKEYIERGAILDAIAEGHGKINDTQEGTAIEIWDEIKKIPAADVVEVRHGEWVIKSVSYRMIDDFDEELYVECPFCKRRFWVAYEFDDEKILKYAREKYPYCHCGAKMDGERKDGK